MYRWEGVALGLDERCCVLGVVLVFREEKIDVGSARHVFPVFVTLEDLGPFAIALWELRRAGIIAGSLPWAVSIHDLEIICDLVELPA
jgi:hypothetical protein